MAPSNWYSLTVSKGNLNGVIFISNSLTLDPVNEIFHSHQYHLISLVGIHLAIVSPTRGTSCLPASVLGLCVISSIRLSGELSPSFERSLINSLFPNSLRVGESL